MKKEMFYSAIAPIFHNARELRNQPTAAENILWMYLRTKPGGYKFRRQHPAFSYILDFYCHALKLAIEVDGSIHDREDVIVADAERQKNLEVRGIRFMRFRNEEILLQIDSVVEKINFAIDEHLKCQPSTKK